MNQISQEFGVLGLNENQRSVLSKFRFDLEGALISIPNKPESLVLVERFNSADNLESKIEVLDATFHYFDEYMSQFSRMFHMLVSDLRDRQAMDEMGINPNEMQMHQFVSLLNYYLGHEDDPEDEEEVTES